MPRIAWTRILPEASGLRPHGLDGLGANETYAESGAETAKGGGEGTSDFCDDHVILCFWFFLNAPPGDSRHVARLESERSVGGLVVVTTFVVADESDVDGGE